MFRKPQMLRLVGAILVLSATCSASSDESDPENPEGLTESDNSTSIGAGMVVYRKNPAPPARPHWEMCIAQQELDEERQDLESNADKDDADNKSNSCCYTWTAIFGVLVVLAVGIPIAMTYLSGEEGKDCFSMLYTYMNKGACIDAGGNIIDVAEADDTKAECEALGHAWKTGQSSPTYSNAVSLDSTADLSEFSFHGDTWVCQQEPSEEHLNGLTPPEKRLCATLESREMYNLRDMDTCDGISQPMPDTIPLCFVDDELSKQFSATAPWGDELVDAANATWGAAINRTFVNHPYQDTGPCVEVTVQDLLNSPDPDDEDTLAHVAKNLTNPERYGNGQITICHDDRCKTHTKELFVHEVGHLLGLKHSTATAGSVMRSGMTTTHKVKPVDKLLDWHDRVRGTALYARK